MPDGRPVEFRLGKVGEVIGAEIFDGRTRLSFSEPLGSGDAVDYLSVRLDGPSLSASRQVYAGWHEGFEILARYFDDLAASWRGWEGERVFESIERDLRIAATHDGHVQMGILLWECSQPGGWRVQAELRLDAGEQLASAARDVAALVRR